METEEDNVRLLRFPAAPGDGRGGEILGLPGRTWLLPLAGLLGTICLLTVFAWTPWSAALPLAGSSAFTAYFFHGRPPRFLEDWCATRLLGPHAELSPRQARAARRDFHPLLRGLPGQKP